MSDREKLGWFQALTIVWGPPVFLILLHHWIAPDEENDLLPMTGYAVSVSLALYLLILSWRLAYLAGQKH